jgi:hypothetical protein
MFSLACAFFVKVDVSNSISFTQKENILETNCHATAYTISLERSNYMGHLQSVHTIARNA